MAQSAKPMIEGYRHGRVPREIREQQLLDVAEEVFAEFGYHGASIEEITRRAAVKRPLIYNYFGGKEGLYLACYERARGELDQRLAAALAEAGEASTGGVQVLDLVRSCSRAYFKFLCDHPSRWDMIYSARVATPGALRDQIRQRRFETVGVLDRAMLAALPDTDPLAAQIFAQAASGVGEHLADWWRQNPDVPLDELVEWCARFVWSGISQVA